MALEFHICPIDNVRTEMLFSSSVLPLELKHYVNYGCSLPPLVFMILIIDLIKLLRYGELEHNHLLIDVSWISQSYLSN